MNAIYIMNAINGSIKAEQLIIEIDKIKDKLAAGVHEKLYSDIANNIGEVLHIVYRHPEGEELAKILNTYYRRMKSFAQRATIPEIKAILHLDKYRFKQLRVLRALNQVGKNERTLQQRNLT